MAFDWSKYEQSGGDFISAAEKKVLAENGIPFYVTAITEKFKFDNNNYELTIRVPNPESGADEERILSFVIGSGAESRDATLAGLKAHIEETGEEVKAKVTKIGRAYFLAQA